MNCRDAIDVMDDAIEGLLPPDVRAGFEDHILECGPCGTYLEHLLVTRRALKTLPGEPGTSLHRRELLEAFRKEFRRTDPDPQ